MNNDDASGKEGEHEVKNWEESHNVMKKSVSSACFRNVGEFQNISPVALRSTRSFTGALEELRFCNHFQRINLNSADDMLNPKLAAMCPSGRFSRLAATEPFRTRERNTLALHIVSPEVLHYHGHDFEPSQIAMFWKKDCRMFLWKRSRNLSTNTTHHSWECNQDNV